MGVVLEAGRDWNLPKAPIRWKWLGKGGEEVWIEHTLVPLRRGRKLVGLEAIGRDISSRMEMTAALEKNRKQAELYVDLLVHDIGNFTKGQMVLFGFLFLTGGIITGAVWANSAWGTYWSWDPKETWSLITWFIYAIFLHCRFMRGWRGKRAAWVSIIGFASVLFTYVGVNLLMKGLHSYA